MRARLSTLFLFLIVAAPVRAQWQTNGLGVNGSGFPQIATDGSGGALIAVESWDPWTGQWDYAIAERVTAAGQRVWGLPAGILLCQSSDNSGPHVVSDGAGGAIFVWFDNRNGYLDLYAQRLNASGTEQWAPCGVPVRVLPIALSAYENLATVSDGAGGVIIAWVDPRGATPDIYVQHLNASGAPLLTVNGGALCFFAGAQRSPVAVEDGSGGAWIAWIDPRSGNDDIYARHVNAAGKPEGIPGGLAVCTAAGSQFVPSIATDEAGGALVAWEDRRAGDSNDNVFAQRVGSAGTMLWTPDGVAVTNVASYKEVPDIASDGSGGAVIAWRDWRSYPNQVAAYAQRLDAAGQTQWNVDGNLLGYSDRPWDIRPAIMADGSGETIVAWGASIFDDQIHDMVPHLFVQRFGTDGAPEWAQPGVPLRGYTGWPGDGGVGDIALVSDGWGGVIAAWTDNRYWQASAVYTGHVSPSGAVTDVHPARGPSMTVANVYPNPFTGTASIAVELPAASKVEVDIFDVAGRKVRSFVDNDAARSKVIQIADRDADGRLLPSGVYFCRVRAAGETVTRKMVIAR